MKASVSINISFAPNMVITMGKAIESCVIVHSVPSSLRRSSLNSLREWDLLTSESLSYGLCSECSVLYEQ